MKCLLPYSKYDGLNIFILLLCLQLSVKCVVSKQPNIIFIIADDLVSSFASFKLVLMIYSASSNIISFINLTVFAAYF